MEDMHAPGYTGAPDVDFLSMMIPHHEGAVEMESPKRKLWQWSDAAEWFMTYLSEPPSTAEDASFIAAVNGALSVRRHAPHLSRSRERKEVVRLITGDVQTLSA